jgi:hypothetical protein
MSFRFAYFEELDAWKDELALQIPFSPGVRYIPGEPLLRSNSGKGATDTQIRFRTLPGSRHLASMKCTRMSRASHSQENSMDGMWT